ncbi:MAG: hypothetical protein M3R36_10530 [Bacteroidota bacterium]|nr:hypothetical protein [Bacteroidota bacterium]
MKNLLKFFVAVFLLISLFQTGYSQIPTYTLTAKNFKTNCYNNQLEWDIYLKHTNPPVDFDMVGHQYFFNLDTTICNGGILTYQIIGSDLLQMFRPRNPLVRVFNDTTVLTLSSNSCPGNGNCGPTITGNGGLNDSNGTLVVRVRLSTSTFFSFHKNPEFLKWRNSPQTAPVTEIVAYIGLYSTKITTPSTHSIDLKDIIPENVILARPKFEEQIFAPVIANWHSFGCNTDYQRYKLEIALDKSFTNIEYLDSNITDTFKVVIGLNSWSHHFWRVYGYDFDSNKFSSPSSILNFQTGNVSVLTLELKLLLEGFYNQNTNKLIGSFPVTVHLRNVNSPYNIIDSSYQIVNPDDFKIYPVFGYASTGIYYLVLKTLNGIETWSKEGGSQFNLNLLNKYYFTDSIQHAYGNNLKLKGAKYCIYSGDVNQDGAIDLNDLETTDNDIINSVSGNNIASDLNGDNLVNLEDLSICDNNAFDFITLIRP